MKIRHGFNSGIQGFRNLGIERILSLLIYYSSFDPVFLCNPVLEVPAPLLY
jgi:hypothetical protein